MWTSCVVNADRPATRPTRRPLALPAAVVAATLVGLLLAGPAGAAATPTPPPPPTPTPRIVFYGDSQLHESRDRIQSLLAARFHSSWDVVIKSFPGSSICAWFDDMRQEHATVVALLFSGVWIGSTCENPLYSHRAWPDAYYQDLTTAIGLLQARSARVVLLHWPEACCQPALPERIWSQYQVIAARYGVTTLDPATVLYNPLENTWPAALPCLSVNEPGCDPATHEVAVRDSMSTANLRGGHLCPMQEVMTPCPVYSSGVQRYAQAMARQVGDLMEETVPARSPPQTRWR
jgi:hypothetical protein